MKFTISGPPKLVWMSGQSVPVWPGRTGNKLVFISLAASVFIYGLNYFSGFSVVFFLQELNKKRLSYHPKYFLIAPVIVSSIFSWTILRRKIENCQQLAVDANEKTTDSLPTSVPLNLNPSKNHEQKSTENKPWRTGNLWCEFCLKCILLRLIAFSKKYFQMLKQNRLKLYRCKNPVELNLSERTGENHVSWE